MTDFIIVGGGLIGMLTARALHQEGASVLLVDKGALGQEASWAGGGILSPLYPWRYVDEISQLARYGQHHYPELCEQLWHETDINPEWTPSGLLIPAINKVEELATAQNWAKKYQVELQYLNNNQAIQQCVPILSAHYNKGLWLPNIAQVRNPRFMKALRADLANRKINIQQHNSVQQILSRNHQVTGIATVQGKFFAKQVIISSGAWSTTFTPFKHLSIVVKPVLGQMILFKAKKNLLQRIILSQGKYLIPRQDGRIVCGSTLEFTQFRKQIHQSAREALFKVAIDLMPILKNFPIEHHWCGLRPGSPNGVPYIGEHPTIKGLYLNAGHYRNGVVIGLASVQILLDLLQQKRSFMDVTAFNLQSYRKPTAEFQP